MKKTLVKLKNNTLFGIIIGMLIMSSGVLATNYLYSSNQISYGSSDVKSAINELYNKSEDIFNYELVHSVDNIKSTSTNFVTSNFTMDIGKYMIVAAGRTIEYGPKFSITGCDEINEVDGIISYSNFTIPFGTTAYAEGRGTGIAKIYKCVINEQKPVTFGCANSGANYYTQCGFGIYK